MIYKRSSYINKPLEEVFSFCSSRDGFLKHFPYKTKWISGADHWKGPGETLRFVFSVGPKKIDYIAEITQFQKNSYFVDVMRKGPYKYFVHEHHFRRHGEGTVYQDVLKFSLGLSPALDWLIGLPMTAMTFRKRHTLMKKALAD